MGQNCCRDSRPSDPDTTSCDQKSGFTTKCETIIDNDECPITLQSSSSLIQANDLFVSWCCRTSMSASALTMWINQYNGEGCPNCRSVSIIPQVLGQTPPIHNGAHALHILAAEGNHPRSVQSLIKMVPASIYAEDSNGRTPLHYAVMCNNDDIVKILCDEGCDPNAVTDDGESALMLAAKQCNPKAIAHIVKAGSTANRDEAVSIINCLISNEKSPRPILKRCLSLLMGQHNHIGDHGNQTTTGCGQ
uniref:Uncharacterized protein n=1 Tax=Spongospora subterranea TaxID=70186 RepID=A0A0H5QM22_9EUKA|eukprot:CRZ03058.1 hypothetical protein [Spongospora subterranea]